MSEDQRSADQMIKVSRKPKIGKMMGDNNAGGPINGRMMGKWE